MPRCAKLITLHIRERCESDAHCFTVGVGTGDNQRYEVALMFARVNTAFSTREVLLANNASRPRMFWSDGDYLEGFGLPKQFSAFIRLLVSTKTVRKSVIGQGLASSTTLSAQVSASVWCATENTQLPADTTTPWTSLGALKLTTPRTGRTVIRRVA